MDTRQEDTSIKTLSKQGYRLKRINRIRRWNHDPLNPATRDFWPVQSLS